MPEARYCDYCGDPDCRVLWGYCHDDCGRKTKIATRNSTIHGYVKGQPLKFLHGHAIKVNKRKGPLYEERIQDYPTPCWVWLWGKSANNYGRYDSQLQAHVVYYERAKGPVPEGLTVDHICHNESNPVCNLGDNCPHRLCVNPDHLHVKTIGNNTRAGRLTRLTIEEVRYIRSLPPRYGLTAALAREFGLHPTWIGMIRNHPDKYWVDPDS